MADAVARHKTAAGPDAIVQCDGCGTFARRRQGQPCPDFWFFLESEDRTPGAPRSVYIVWACSAECRDKLWHSAVGGTQADLARRPSRKGNPGRGGIGGKRIAELEAALAALLDVIHAVPGGEGSKRGCWFKGEVDNYDVVEHARHVLRTERTDG